MNNISDTLVREHHLLDQLLSDCHAALRCSDFAEAGVLLDRFSDMLLAHAKVEDEALFPAMTRRRLVKRDDVNDMGREHTQMLKLVDEIRALIVEGKAAAAMHTTEALQRSSRGHAQKEELLLLARVTEEVAGECPPYP